MSDTPTFLNTEAAARGFEFWAIVPDYEAFAANFPACAKKLEELCALQGCSVKIFLGSPNGYRGATSLAAKYRDCDTHLTLCQAFGPEFNDQAVLRRVAFDDDFDYFESTDGGFRRLAPSEWSRLERMLPALLSRVVGTVAV